MKILIIIFILFSANLQSQMKSPFELVPGLGIELQIGYPSFNLDPLKEARNKGISSFEFPAKVTDDYPHIPYIHGEILFCSKIVEIGVAYSFLTTGSRVHYADYSGEYKFDNSISNSEYGLVIKTMSFNDQSSYGIQFFGELGIATLRMKSEEYIMIGNEKQSSNDLFTNKMSFGEIGLNGNYYLGMNFIVSVGVSYYIELEKVLTIGFDGFRAHTGIGYRIPFGK